MAILEWLTAQEYYFASPVAGSSLQTIPPFLTLLSFGIMVGAFLLQLRGSLQCWTVPTFQIGPIQAQLCICAAPVLSSLQVFYPSVAPLFVLVQTALLGFALILTGLSLPRRYAATCLGSSMTNSNESVWSLGAVVCLMVLRPLSAALLTPRVNSASIASMSFALVQTVLLGVGIFSLWLAGLGTRRGKVGDRLPQLSYAFFILSSLAWLWEVQDVLSAYALSAMSAEAHQTLLSKTVLHYVEAAAVVGMLHQQQAAERDPIIQLAATSSESIEEHRNKNLLFNGDWRSRSQALLLLIDLLRPLREALFAPSGPSWVPLSHSVLTPAGYFVPREAIRAQQAWCDWANISRVHRAWPGLKQGMDGELEVVPPSELTAEEEMYSRYQALEMHTSWPFVFADLFTDRVHSKLLAVVVALIASTTLMHSEPKSISDFRQSQTNPVVIFGLQVAALAVMWLCLGLLLIGNNVFLPSAFAYRVWAWGLAVWLFREGTARLLPLFMPLRSVATSAMMQEPDRWYNCFVGLCALLGVFLSARIAIQSHNRNDYHQTTMDSLRYTSDLLQASASVTELRKNPLKTGEQVLVRPHKNFEEKGKVLKNHNDGTVDVKLDDGREYMSMRLKWLSRMPRGEKDETKETSAKRMSRLKEMLSSADNYPSSMLFGAIFTIPLVIAMCFGAMYATKRVLSQLYRLHVMCCLLVFFIKGHVVPDGPPATATDNLGLYRSAIVAWRTSGGTGPANTENLAHLGLQGLAVRYDDGKGEDPWPSTPCSDLKLPGKVLAVMSEGDLAAGEVDFTFDKLLDFADFAWSYTYIPPAAKQRRNQVLEAAWSKVTGGNRDTPLKSSAAGDMLCEIKLMAGSASGYMSPSEELFMTFGMDFIMASKAVVHGEKDISSSFMPLIEEYGMELKDWAVNTFGLHELEAATLRLQAIINDPMSVEDPAKELKEILTAVLNSLERVNPVWGASAKDAVKEAQRTFGAQVDQAFMYQDLVTRTGKNLSDILAASREIRGQLDSAHGKALSGKLNPIQEFERLQASMAAVVEILEGTTQTWEEKFPGAVDLAKNLAERRLEELGPTEEPPPEEPKTMYDVVMNNPVVGVFMTIADLLSQDWIIFALVGFKWGLTVSMFVSLCSVLFVIARCFWKYRQLFEKLQMGRKDYQGASQEESLKVAFAETTLFPGVLMGTCVIGFVVVTITTLVSLTLFVLTVLPMCLPTWLAPFLPTVRYLIIAFALKKFIQLVLLNNLLTDSGEVRFPWIFSLFWLVQLILNLFIGLSLALARIIMVLCISAVSCCFLDFSVVPERLMTLDPGYMSLLSNVYLQHQCANPIKVSAITAMSGSSQRVFRKKQMDRYDAEAVAKRRVRARFLMGITLHNNPDLVKHRVYDRASSKGWSIFGQDLGQIHDKAKMGINKGVNTAGAAAARARTLSTNMSPTGMNGSFGGGNFVASPYRNLPMQQPIVSSQNTTFSWNFFGSPAQTSPASVMPYNTQGYTQGNNRDYMSLSPLR